MAHVNDGLIASDNEHTDFILYPIVEDASLYSNQYSQTQYNTTGEIIYDSRATGSEVDYTAMLSGEDSTLEDLHSAQNSKTIPPNFYSLDSLTHSPATYQSHGFCLPNNVEAYDFHSAYIPRTIGNLYTTSTAEESTLTASIDENPRFLLQAPTFHLGLQLGSHTVSDYRSTPSASPATSIGGFEGPSSGINSAIGSLGSARSSARGSPYSAHEDSWSGGIAGTVESLEQGPDFWDGSGFIGRLCLNPLRY